MKQIITPFLLVIFLVSCGGATKSAFKKKPKSKADKVISNAQAFDGTRYKYGGTTNKGMDCSGLIYVAFQKEDITLPRISRDMAKEGTRIKDSQIQKGDLLFFKTNKKSNRINHVGLVTKSSKGEIYFIHSTSSKGVLTSNLNERYWKNAYVSARRVL